MKRSGIFSACCGLLCLFAISISASADVTTPPIPADTFDICIGETIYDTLVVDLNNPDDPDIGMELVSGPGTLQYEISGSQLLGFYEYTPTGDTIYRLEYLVRLSATDSLIKYHDYRITVNETPIIDDQYNSFKVCYDGPRYLKVYARDPEYKPITFEILSGPGTIENDGLLTYTPDTAGVYTFEISVSDSCSADTAFVYDTIRFNSRPILYPTEHTFLLCAPEEICFDVYFPDPDGDEVWFEFAGGPGTTTLINDTTAQTCFTPGPNDSCYTFTYSYLDNCEGSQTTADPTWVHDTVTVCIQYNQPPQITCPEPQEFFTCVTDTFCFAVEAVDPDFEDVTFNVLSGNAWIDGGQVCFVGDSSSQFDITIEAVDSCGLADTCTVPVTVNGNRPPYVMSADDFAMTFCVPEEICFRATADDPDLDIADVVVNFGTYNEATDLVCFTPDTAGVYSIIVTATDSCGVSASDTTNVTITIPDPPTVDLGPDFDAYQCGAEEICLDVTISADSVLAYILPASNIFTFDSVASTICFTPDTAGAYTVIFGVRGECEFEAIDTAVVNVIFPPEPFVDLGDDQFFDLCLAEEICVDVSTVNGFQSVTTNFGTWDAEARQVCFTPEGEGDYEIIVDLIDSCGFAASDTVLITVELDDPPMVAFPDDTSLYICEPTEICVEPTVIDVDGNLDIVTTNIGTYDGPSGQLCFFADTTGIYEIILTAVDSCGFEAVDTMAVTVELATESTVSLGEDLEFNLCAPEEICIKALVTADDIDSLIGPSLGTYDPVTGNICFTPDTAGVYEIIFGVVDGCGLDITDTVLVTVTLTEPPTVSLGDDFSLDLCQPEEICVDVDWQAGSIMSGPIVSLGQFDPETDQICFTPDGAGTYEMTFFVQDSCGSVAADTVYITVDFGAPPMVHIPDTTVYLCEAEYVCLPLTVEDPDNDIAELTVNRGMFPGDGRVCFIAYTGGDYEIIVTAVDSCGNVAIDTANVTVITDEGVAIECPGDTTVFTCSLVDTFCFPIEGIPDSAEVTVTGINTWYDEENGTICFWSQCSNQNRITVTATTPCSEYTCEFSVTVLCNDEPLAFLPSDTTTGICGPTEFCVPVGVSDRDGNLDTIIVTGGVYNPSTSRICVDLDTAGIYEVTVTAIDSCGAQAYDEMTISVVDNQPPTVEVIAPDTAIRQCIPEPICLPVIITEPDGQDITLVSITDGFSYDADSSEICFTPDTSGVYCGEIVIEDICGVKDTASFCVTVEAGSFVRIYCPGDTLPAFGLCEPQPICVEVPIQGTAFEVTTNIGTWVDGEFCFTPDTSGIYSIQITGTAECNSDTCEFDVPVEIVDPVAITCPGDTSVFLCGPDTLCFDYTTTALSDSVEIIGNAYLSNGTVCVPMLAESGEETITLIANSTCNEDTCSFTVTYSRNSAPTLSVIPADPVTTCDTATVCITYAVNDPNGNLATIDAGDGIVGDSTICFPGLTPGVHDVTIIATDSCGAADTATARLRVLVGQSASIFCPTTAPVDTICAPDTICVVAPVSPVGAEVIVSPVGYYDVDAGEVCIPVSETGTITITMIASAECGADTCSFDVEVVRSEPPTVSCPSEIDTLLCLTDPQTICYPVTVSGTSVDVSVSGGATYSNGEVCLTVSEPGTYDVTLTAAGYCDTVSCMTSITVSGDQPPVLELPAFQTFERCPDDTDQICIDGIFATDAESIPTVTMTCGVGDFTQVVADSGGVCFMPDTFGVYTFCYEATDGCNVTQGSFEVEIVEQADCEVCVKVWLESGECTPVGVSKSMQVFIEAQDRIGGFDLLMEFDRTVMTFNSITSADGVLSDWEYFTYRLDDIDCGESCGSRYLRLIGIADMNNGSAHPPEDAYTPNGLALNISFLIANDQNLGSQFLPVRFVWFDCGDNSFSDPTGQDQLIDLRIYNYEGNLIWDEEDDVNYPDSERPQNLGAPDVCVQDDPEKPAAVRCVEFYNGGIWVCHPDSLDDRGDINLNGVAYEIGDAVVFSNYFIYGLTAFTVSIPGQTAASDVNADGLTLTVSDLVYLIRVIVGDATPIPRLTPYNDDLVLDSERDGSRFVVTADAPGTIGAAHLVYKIDGDVAISDVRPGSDAAGMDLMWNVVGDELRLLLFDIGEDRVRAGTSEIIEITVSGDGALMLSDGELADYEGRPYTVAGRTGALPSAFVLEQNYPNPFNPTTTISFTLPQATDWALEVFNVNGGLVREFDGATEAGTVTVEWDGRSSSGHMVASGVYFYRLVAGEFTDTKKMILLK